MTQGSKRWSTADLELYHDDELDAERRQALSDALRRDPQLRERLSTVGRLDDLTRAALAEQSPARGDVRRPTWRRVATGLAAACVLLAGSAYVWHAAPRRPVEPVKLVDRTLPDRPEGARPAEYEAIRVVLSIPVAADALAEPSGQEQSPSNAPYADAASDAVREQAALLMRLDAAVADERIEEAVGLLEGLPDSQRTIAYRYLGHLVDSALVAREILDRLGAPEQLAVCREWAHDPARRPVVFDRLRRLSREPAWADDVRLLVAQLAEEPVLRSWIRGYQLTRPPATERDASS